MSRPVLALPPEQVDRAIMALVKRGARLVMAANPRLTWKQAVCVFLAGVEHVAPGAQVILLALTRPAAGREPPEPGG